MLATGKKGTLTLRDESILTDLYLTACLTTGQIAAMHFTIDGAPSPTAAERRLYRLAEKGYVETRSLDTPEGNHRKVWILTEQAWIREHRDLREDSNPEASMVTPKPGRLEHFISTNHLYTEAAPTLREHFAEPDSEEGEGWYWRHEYNCEHSISLGENQRKVKPDAEVDILDTTLYIESQTKRSKASPERMASKVDGYARYFRYVLDDTDQLNQLLVISEEPKIIHAVESKAEELELMVVCGTLETLIHHINVTALRLS